MKKLQDMTIKEKVGQLFFAGFPGKVYDEHVRTLVEDYKLGNIILFARNVGEVRELHDLNMNLHKNIKAATGVMPLISIDQEGGIVTRIMDGATFLPGAMSIGATHLDNAYKLGSISGAELRALGINMNLAPVLDVNNNPKNPVIGVRSYSDKPEVVSRFGNKFISGLQDAGIIATAKHFPGHGDTAVDSHYALPTVAHNKERLNKIELVPFKNAISAGLDSIMSAHVFFPAYEEGNLPATLSYNVMTKLLREELGFNGLIVSDCMEMKAISDNYTTPKGVLMGLLAGLDMVFVSQTLENQTKALDLVYSAVESGEFPLSLLDEKVARVLKYKEKVAKTMDKYFFSPKYEEKFAVITSEESKKLSSSVVDTSLTKVRGKDIYPNEKTLVIAVEPFAQTIAEDEIDKRSIVDVIKKRNLPFDVRKISVRVSSEEIAEIVNLGKYYKQVVVCTFNANFYSSQVDLVKGLFSVVEDLFVIATRNPYDIKAFEFVRNYLCLYEYTPNSVSTIVKYLNKEIMPAGRLPISLDDEIEVGASIYVGLAEYPLSENLKYLDLLKKNKIEKVFISAHIPEANKDFLAELTKVTNYANELGLKIILDVSKPMMENFPIPKIYSLRLDWGFSMEDVVELTKTKDFVIELNASAIDKAYLDNLIALGVDLTKLRTSHNFFPKVDSGLSYRRVAKTNEVLKSYGLPIMGYIPSQVGKRPPMKEGLPTIEAHRYQDLRITLQEMKALGFSEVVFGDAYASSEELSIARDFDYSTHLIPLRLFSPLEDFQLEHLLSIHYNRLDAPDNLIRSSKRIKEGVVEAINTVKRSKFLVTMDNLNSLRYQGEVMVMKRDLEASNYANVIGEALISERLLHLIKPGDKFKFIIEK